MKTELENLIVSYKDMVDEYYEEAQLKMHDFRELMGRKEQVESIIMDLEFIKDKKK